MAEKKNMTRKEALEIAAHILDKGRDACEYTNEQVTDAIAVLDKMIAQVSKPRKKSDTPSKTRLINENLASQVVAAMRERDQKTVTSKWVMEHVKGIMSSQKVTSVMAIAIERGEIEKSKEGKNVVYSLV